MRNTKIAVVVAALLGSFGLGYYASPYWAVRQMRSAAEQRDADRLAEYVDFPAVRESIKSQAMAKFMEDSATELKDNPFAGLAGVVASALVDKFVDSFVTPAGMAALMEKGKPADAVPDMAVNNGGRAVTVSARAPAEPERKPQVTMGYDGIDRFEVAVFSESEAKAVTFKLRREGLFGWRLRAIRLPL